MNDDRGNAYDAAVEFAKVALNAVFLANGGGIVGILTFIGSVWRGDQAGAALLAENMKTAVLFFIFGIVLALLATGFAYLAQYRYLQESPSGHNYRLGAMLATIASMAMFIVGAWCGISAFYR